ncbi:pyridoxamine 5'-phosphate oxidase family protein [Saliphagus infecundisoli]|uniref:Pyridoxamine 5'-phosphate oxidase family protein n=1 Tax=Saliphagus infecundisoli TaxID=1849069 RepID=A0ABD5QG46_9EURY|nr:pyridoxamine 5'-phosphate oxidase family protein [Saliphagus infecundisoli]
MSVPPEAERLLESRPLMAHLATSVEDRPHVAPVWYRYEDGTIDLSIGGRKLENVRANPRVALSVQHDEDGDARWMVSLRGTARVVEEREQAEAAIARINEKYGASADSYGDNEFVRVEIGSATYSTY